VLERVLKVLSGSVPDFFPTRNAAHA
jgi:hypothetical protein